MADLKGRSKDMKDKVVGEGKEAYGKATDDKSKETEGKAQSCLLYTSPSPRD